MFNNIGARTSWGIGTLDVTAKALQPVSAMGLGSSAALTKAGRARAATGLSIFDVTANALQPRSKTGLSSFDVTAKALQPCGLPAQPKLALGMSGTVAQVTSPSTEPSKRKKAHRPTRGKRALLDRAVINRSQQAEQAGGGAKTKELTFRVISLEEQVDEQRILHADLHRVSFHLVHAQIVDRVRLTDEPVEQVVDAILSSIPDGPFR